MARKCAERLVGIATAQAAGERVAPLCQRLNYLCFPITSLQNGDKEIPRGAVLELVSVHEHVRQQPYGQHGAVRIAPVTTGLSSALEAPYTYGYAWNGTEAAVVMSVEPLARLKEEYRVILCALLGGAGLIWLIGLARLHLFHARRWSERGYSP